MQMWAWEMSDLISKQLVGRPPGIAPSPGSPPIAPRPRPRLPALLRLVGLEPHLLPQPRGTSRLDSHPWYCLYPYTRTKDSHSSTSLCPDHHFTNIRRPRRPHQLVSVGNHRVGNTWPPIDAVSHPMATCIIHVD